MIISTKAIVLKTILYGDSSLISRVFTEKNGKISVMAKGAWRPKNTTGPMLEPMNHISIQYYHKKSRQIQVLKDAHLVQQFFNIRSDLNKIILGQAIVEILDKSTPEENPLPVLYRLGWRILERMNASNVNYWVLFSFYLYQLSLRLGFMPNLKTCYKCQSLLNKALIDDKAGELICPNCNLYGKLFLNDNSLNFLKNLENMHLDEIENQMYSSLEILNAVNFLEVFTYFHLEGMDRVRSISMMKKLIKQ